LKTYADVNFNAVTPAFHPTRDQTRNYCSNLTWGGIDTWQPLDEQDIWKLVSANHPFDFACSSNGLPGWGCQVFSTSWSSKTPWVAPPEPWNSKLSLDLYNNNWYRSWNYSSADGCSANDSVWFNVWETDIYSYPKFETDTRWPNARPMVICKATVMTDTDNDGISDTQDNCPIKPNGPDLGTCSSTSDKPGGNCTSDADCANGCSSNGLCIKDQRDTDADGFGDVCDICDGNGAADTDNDGYCDLEDNCPNNCNANQLDADSDGIGDVCDTTPGCGGCGLPQCEQQC
jgi:hypothetical protein